MDNYLHKVKLELDKLIIRQKVDFSNFVFEQMQSFHLVAFATWVVS